MENNPTFGLNGKNGEQYEGTPDNAELFMYLGKIGLYSHALVQLSYEPPVFTRLFNHHTGFTRVRDYMLENGYPIHANLRAVGASVLKSFELDMANQAEDLDRIPSDWLDEQEEA